MEHEGWDLSTDIFVWLLLDRLYSIALVTVSLCPPLPWALPIITFTWGCNPPVLYHLKSFMVH